MVVHLALELFRAVKTRRFAAGILLLLIVDAIWVASTALTEVKYIKLASFIVLALEHIYNDKESDNYPKPIALFTVYFKTSLFTTYLVASIFWRSWQ